MILTIFLLIVFFAASCIATHFYQKIVYRCTFDNDKVQKLFSRYDVFNELRNHFIDSSKNVLIARFEQLHTYNIRNDEHEQKIKNENAIKQVILSFVNIVKNHRKLKNIDISLSLSTVFIVAIILRAASILLFEKEIPADWLREINIVLGTALFFFIAANEVVRKQAYEKEESKINRFHEIIEIYVAAKKIEV